MSDKQQDQASGAVPPIVTDAQIVDAFQSAGMRIESGAAFSARGQIAALINGYRTLAASPAPPAPVAPRAPDGWKLVPDEPTADMRHHGVVAHAKGVTRQMSDTKIAADVYRSMLAAAPVADGAADGVPSWWSAALQEARKDIKDSAHLWAVRQAMDAVVNSIEQTANLLRLTAELRAAAASPAVPQTAQASASLMDLCEKGVSLYPKGSAELQAFYAGAQWAASNPPAAPPAASAPEPDRAGPYGTFPLECPCCGVAEHAMSVETDHYECQNCACCWNEKARGTVLSPAPSEAVAPPNDSDTPLIRRLKLLAISIKRYDGLRNNFEKHHRDIEEAVRLLCVPPSPPDLSALTDRLRELDYPEDVSLGPDRRDVWNEAVIACIAVLDAASALPAKKGREKL